jgi:hypothetical protein
VSACSPTAAIPAPTISPWSSSSICSAKVFGSLPSCADGDPLFALADLGDPELGSFSLAEKTAVLLPFGMGDRADILFATDLPLSVWAEAARQAGSIRGAERILLSAARSGQDDG